MNYDPVYVREVAERELQVESFRDAVEREKARLRRRRALWRRIRSLLTPWRFL